MYTVGTDNILTIALLRNKNKGVTIGQIKRFTEIAQAELENCDFDNESKCIWSLLEYGSGFKYKDDECTIIEFSDKVDYEKEMKRLEYILPLKVLEVLLNCDADRILNCM